MKRYPVIGISGSISKSEKELSINAGYNKALMTAGAVPVLLTPFLSDDMLSACLDGLDGLLLAGGNDVAPDRYGHDPINELGEVNPLRDEFECRLIRMAVERKMPILGICRGIQSMNVAMGGTLWQDVPSQFVPAQKQEKLAHSQTRADCYTSHRVIIEPGSMLHRIIGQQEIRVNSFHHQGVREPAPGLAVAAHASDGLIESIEHPGLPFFLGVQWHPERYFDRDETAMALFSALVEAAKG